MTAGIITDGMKESMEKNAYMFIPKPFDLLQVRMLVKMILDESDFFSSRRRHSIGSRDWSSDVCSSDLFQFLLTRSSWESVWALAESFYGHGDAKEVALRYNPASSAVAAPSSSLPWFLIYAAF